MAQDGTTAGGASYSLDNVTFPVGRNKLQSIFNAIRTNNKGASAPDLVAGQFWIDDSTDPTWTLYLYDGTDSIQFATINTTDNSVNFIDSTFTQLTSDLSTNGNDINFGDNDKAQFGAGNDLQIYSDGANGFIKEVDASGYLYIQGTNLRLQNTAGTQTYVNANDNGAVDLRYAGSTKIATTSTGIDVTGTVTASSFLSGDNSGSKLNFNDDIDPLGGVQQNFTTLSSIGGVNILFDTNNNDTMGFLVASDNAVSSSAKKRFYITENGDISFYEDTGTTPKFFWDASAESLGIGTSSPNNPQAVNLHISGTSSAIRMSDTTNSLTGNLYASGGEFSVLTSSSHPLVFKTANSERMRIASNGRVGIGTSSPERLLHLQSSAPEIMMKDSDDSSYNTILSNGGTLSITTSAGTLNVEPLGAGAVQLASPTSLGFNIGSGYNYEFDVNGTEAMRIDNNRNVGIGTSSPSSMNAGANQLVVGNGSTGQGLTIYSSTTTAGSIHFADGTSGDTAYRGQLVYNHNGDYMSMYIAASEAMRITSSGNVGIGTSSPAFSSGYGGLHISSTYPELRMTGTNSGHTNTDGFKIQYNSSNTAFLWNYENADLGFGTNNSLRMYITSSGNVGIGTASPDQLLHLSASQGATLRFESTTTGATTGDIFGAIEFETQDSSSAGVKAKIDAYSEGGVGNASLRFFTGDTVSLDEAMRIDSSGNVGIGTTDTTGQKFIVEDDLADYMTRFINQGNNANRYGILIQAGADDGSGTTRYLTATDGDGNATGALETSSGTFQLIDISDERLKQDIIDTSINGLDAISNMRIVDFSYKKNPSHTVIGGFIAQELQQIFPQAVSSDNTEENILSVSRERLVPVLVKAIQEQQTIIEQLEARISALET